MEPRTKIIREYFLEPKHDNRKSFYKKAYVMELSDGRIWLRSYDTVICALDSSGGVHIEKLYSATSNRHMVEFLRQWYVDMDMSAAGFRRYIAEHPGDKAVMYRL